MNAARVVILGAGYAGLRTALALEAAAGPRRAAITLIDRREHHQLVTELHRVAAGALDADAALLPLSLLLRGREVRFVQDEVRRIDLPARTVHLAEGTEPYDILVVALGSVPSYFGVPGAQEFAFTIRTWDDAVRLTDAIPESLATGGLGRGGRVDRLVVVGGGATGCELAGELADWVARARGESERVVAEVVLVSATPRLLPEMDPAFGAAAARSLAGKGVGLRLGEAVVAVEPDAVVLEDGRRLEAAAIVWAGGVAPPPLLAESGLPTAGGGRVRVDAHLRAEGHPRVYVAGDSALVLDPRGIPLPPTAHLADQEGEYLGREIAASLRGRTTGPFEPHVEGTVVSLGEGEGVGSVGHLQVRGWAAHTAKRFTLERYLYSLGGIRALREFDRRAET